MYWNHRIWPKENPGAKPPLAAVMSDQAIRAKVDDYLRKSNALERFWQRPVTAEQLQAELDRMAKNTRDGATLQELFGALGNDPFVIAETLVRQNLVDRLIRNWYASDTRFHSEVRAKAEASLVVCASVDCMKMMGGEYRETTTERNARAKSLEVGRLSRLDETLDAFLVRAVSVCDATKDTTVSVAWPKRSFDDWWNLRRGALGSDLAGPSATFTLPDVRVNGCTIDTWRPTHAEVPDVREFHSAVWTGTEMIVWGGGDPSRPTRTGGRYNPATDSWSSTSTGANVPAARDHHTAVWTGTEMIVWGGSNAPAEFNTGGSYDPSTDSWTATSVGPNVPSPRDSHTAVWTGTEMIVWGGIDPTYLNNGGRYDPVSDSWIPVQLALAPTARRDHTAVWTGTEMIVWGGRNSGGTPLGDGARYTPSNDLWVATPPGQPTARYGHTAVWTGTQMIIWGGRSTGATFFNTGSRYTPFGGWTSTGIGANVPSGRSNHTAVWSGTEMIVWGGTGGATGTGGRYNPSNDSWSPTSTGANVPPANDGHTAVWTGTEMIVWGGKTSPSTVVNSGGRYSPATNSWVPTTTVSSVPVARASHLAVWTGTEMIVWGGRASSGYVNTGGRYSPSADSWMATSTGPNVPSARERPSAVWTGTEMIVWGGNDGPYLSTGGRYNPSSDSWMPTQIAGAPTGRSQHTAVWTGTEMIVWGGYDSADLNTGGRYKPSTDSWTPTSTGANVPTARTAHTAVWTGTEMIVWGGFDAAALNTGGRYKPSIDSWTPTATGANVPAARGSHAAVWTGTEMIVWGGDNLNSGGRYNPSTDGWAATSTGANVPAGRYDPMAIWTGAEMIVWGSDGTELGGRYDPSTDSWTATSAGTNVPSARNFHTLAWTGTEMIAWGGNPTTSTGGLYCACPGGGTYFRDADGDGYGNRSLFTSVCAGAIPLGFVADSSDCNDANPAIHPAAPEINDGLDNQCAGEPGYGAIDEISGVSGFFSSSDHTLFSWPAQAGATSYEIARSPYSDFHAGCVHNTTAATSWSDPAVPPPGTRFHYLVRALAPRIGSWGKKRPSADRSVCVGCVNTGDWCDDTNLCTIGDTCTGAVCGGTPLSCDDGNVCTTDSCDPVLGCVHVNNTNGCDDGNACTTSDVCQGGVCVGAVPNEVHHLVISQFQVAGGSSFTDEFVEIYNPTQSAIALAGLSLQYRAAGLFTVFVVHPLGAQGVTVVPARGWVLLAPAAYDGPVAADELVTEFAMDSATGHVALAIGTTGLGLTCPIGANVIDKLGYGSTSCAEGTATTAPSENNSKLRRPGGACGNGTDTDSNSADFVSQSPSTPRNHLSPPQP